MCCVYLSLMFVRYTMMCINGGTHRFIFDHPPQCLLEILMLKMLCLYVGEGGGVYLSLMFVRYRMMCINGGTHRFIFDHPPQCLLEILMMLSLKCC